MRPLNTGSALTGSMALPVMHPLSGGSDYSAHIGTVARPRLSRGGVMSEMRTLCPKCGCTSWQTECPECVTIPYLRAQCAAKESAIAQAVAAERERCCQDVCGGCRYGIELVRRWTHDGQPYELWLHINRETLTVTDCVAAAIRARTTP